MAAYACLGGPTSTDVSTDWRPRLASPVGSIDYKSTYVISWPCCDSYSIVTNVMVGEYWRRVVSEPTIPGNEFNYTKYGSSQPGGTGPLIGPDEKIGIGQICGRSVSDVSCVVVPVDRSLGVAVSGERADPRLCRRHGSRPRCGEARRYAGVGLRRPTLRRRPRGGRSRSDPSGQIPHWCTAGRRLFARYGITASTATFHGLLPGLTPASTGCGEHKPFPRSVSCPFTWRTTPADRTSS